ncbi:MAG: nucleotide exchange factor GrpE [Oscillospiraceae bacterium]|nr:nucleotide exchange factor GrpE [Oscillospiraceae bacterium]
MKEKHRMKNTKPESNPETPEAATEEESAEEMEETIEQPIETTESQLEAVISENLQLKDSMLRQMAEFDNFRKRAAKEKSEIYGMAMGDCVAKFLGVHDNLERAVGTLKDDSEFKSGISMVLDGLLAVMTELGVTEIESSGAKFDPNLHDAVQQIEDESFGENEVCNVLQKGFKSKDKVIRHAVVVVANP